MSTTETYVPRLKQAYDEEIRAALKEELGLSSVMMVPKVAKITLNMGVGDAKTDAKALDSAIEELTTIAGQRAQVRRARKSIASFKLREGMAVGARVTLRGARMYEFLDRLVSIALPRIRDFRGLDPGSFDGRGNYSLGIREQIIFPEIDYDSVQSIRGLDVAITTTAANDEQAARASARARSAVCRRGKGTVSGQEVADREAGNARRSSRRRGTRAAISAGVLVLLPQVRSVPDLLAGARARGCDSRDDEVELVGARRC